MFKSPWTVGLILVLLLLHLYNEGLQLKETIPTTGDVKINLNASKALQQENQRLRLQVLAEKQKDQELISQNKQAVEEVATKKGEEEAATKKAAEESAAVQKAEEEAIAAKKAVEEEAAARKAEATPPPPEPATVASKFTTDWANVEIPKLIHLTFFGLGLTDDQPPLPANVARNVQKFRDLNPDYEVRVWNNTMLKREFPAVAHLVQNVSRLALTSDIARYFILEKHGGLYFDTDVNPIKPIEPLRKELSPGFGACWPTNSSHPLYPIHYSECKGANQFFLSCAPHHPLFQLLSKFTFEKTKNWLKRKPNPSYVVGITGPVTWTEVLDIYINKNGWQDQGMTEEWWATLSPELQQSYKKKPWKQASWRAKHWETAPQRTDLELGVPYHFINEIMVSPCGKGPCGKKTREEKFALPQTYAEHEFHKTWLRKGLPTIAPLATVKTGQEQPSTTANMTTTTDMQQVAADSEASPLPLPAAAAAGPTENETTTKSGTEGEEVPPQATPGAAVSTNGEEKDVSTTSKLQEIPSKSPVLNPPEAPSKITSDWATTEIPKIIHLTFYGRGLTDEQPPLPADVARNVQRHKELNPDYEIRVWNNTMLKREFPAVVKLVQNVTRMALTSDISRYFILEKYGGIYFDTDVYPVKSIEPLRKELSPGFGACLPKDSAHPLYPIHYRQCKGVNQFFLSCAPHHPLFQLLSNYTFEKTKNWLKRKPNPSYVVGITGPITWTEVLEGYTNKNGWIDQGMTDEWMASLTPELQRQYNKTYTKQKGGWRAVNWRTAPKPTDLELGVPYHFINEIMVSPCGKGACRGKNKEEKFALPQTYAAHEFHKTWLRKEE